MDDRDDGDNHNQEQKNANPDNPGPVLRGACRRKLLISAGRLTLSFAFQSRHSRLRAVVTFEAAHSAESQESRAIANSKPLPRN
jgi:hypothetical protein